LERVRDVVALLLHADADGRRARSTRSLACASPSGDAANGKNVRVYLGAEFSSVGGGLGTNATQYGRG
jgi:hypothetical protein